MISFKMSYYRRKARTIWVGILLLLFLVLLVFNLSSFLTFPVDSDTSRSPPFYNNYPRDAAARRSDAGAAARHAAGPPTSTDLFQRIDLDLRRSPVDAEKIVDSIHFLNAAHEVRNAERWGAPTDASVTFVIVVQVHKRIEYLVYLINSLRDVVGIQDALLVFSHDFDDEQINTLIQSIAFCRVIQIFYPYNIQIFPNMFPGQDPRDCPAKATKQEVETLKCKNRKFPDKYGNYRTASLTQIKHHWWWKMNYVFEKVLKKYALNQYVILLEEDHFLMPDSLHVLRSMIDGRNTMCKDCDIFCLGAYLKDYKNYRADIAKLSVFPWFTSKHNMGMAISPQTWELFRNCSEMFCTFDDYNWDWSLLAISLNCLPARPRVLVAKSPRVIHIGDCGVHAHRCEPHNAAAFALELIAQHNASFFPERLALTEVSKRSFKPPKPNGGWGDIRDHALCLLNSMRGANASLSAQTTERLANGTLHSLNDILSLF